MAFIRDRSTGKTYSSFSDLERDVVSRSRSTTTSRDTSRDTSGATSTSRSTGGFGGNDDDIRAGAPRGPGDTSRIQERTRDTSGSGGGGGSSRTDPFQWRRQWRDDQISFDQAVAAARAEGMSEPQARIAVSQIRQPTGGTGTGGGGTNQAGDPLTMDQVLQAYANGAPRDATEAALRNLGMPDFQINTVLPQIDAGVHPKYNRRPGTTPGGDTGTGGTGTDNVFPRATPGPTILATPEARQAADRIFEQLRTGQIRADDAINRLAEFTSQQTTDAARQILLNQGLLTTGPGGRFSPVFGDVPVSLEDIFGDTARRAQGSQFLENLFPGQATGTFRNVLDRQRDPIGEQFTLGRVLGGSGTFEEFLDQLGGRIPRTTQPQLQQAAELLAQDPVGSSLSDIQRGAIGALRSPGGQRSQFELFTGPRERALPFDLRGPFSQLANREFERILTEQGESPGFQFLPFAVNNGLFR